VSDGEPWTLAVALGIGLLLGIERERRKGRGPTRRAAGIRTFALVALLGGISVRVGGTAGLAVGAAFVGLAALIAYVRAMATEEDPGLTTEVALVVAFMLGALAQDEPELAAALGVAVTILLASRTRLHRLVRDTLTEDELHDGLVFAAAALVVLPLAPNRDLGPYGALNPFTIWRLVVLIMAISAAGYVALRIVGPRYGLPLAGFASGFVSSILTIVAMGRRAAKEPGIRAPAVAGAVASSVATVVLNAVILGATSPDALRELALPLLLAGAGTAAAAGIAAVRSARSRTPETISPGRAFDLRSAVLFAGLLTAVILAGAALTDALGTTGLTLAAAVAGFADAQAATASAASLVATGSIDPKDALVPVFAGLTTNTVSKAVAAAVAGRFRFALGVWPGLAILVGSVWAGVAIVSST
jgi:uncharacterized membrane protein (DUF4010 family)